MLRSLGLALFQSLGRLFLSGSLKVSGICRSARGEKVILYFESKLLQAVKEVLDFREFSKLYMRPSDL